LVRAIVDELFDEGGVWKGCWLMEVDEVVMEVVVG